ncbi:cell division control protein 45 [[Candida] railenensis]|uniref:Cell division control protein 45 n=1 Tax=[Candida] railenensis TaxID=45579 RepID=A0A9P0QT12_9ASCO|nr:cell division control protein 45 [[Candida] railenensis]
MYISPAQYSDTFKEIKRTSLSHSTCKLVIFVACLDIDSLCSAKILSLVFKKELIQYQLIPVVGYTDLKGHFLKLDDDISNVILIGCGSMLDLESFFDIEVDEFVVDRDESSKYGRSRRDDDFTESDGNEIELRRKIYVIDGHRPWNLDNLFGSSMVVCLDDGYVEENLSTEKSAYIKLVNDEEGDEVEGSESETTENEDDDEEEEEGDDEDEEEVGILSEEDDTLINSDSSDPTRKRKRVEKQQMKSLRKQRKRERTESENVLESYYNQGTTIFTSTSAIIYSVLTLIGETSIENLWLAIIGTSSLDNQYPQVYDKIQPLFKEEVIRLNPEDGNNSNGGSNGVNADTSTLSIDKDYHLFLLRHWTLYDSFFYSSHVNSKLNLWTEDGKKKLHKLFAKMGISLAIAQQKWLYVDIGIKKQIPSIFKKYLPLYGLEGIVREGFIRTFGYMGQLSAMECVESLTALLESDKRIFDNSDQNSTNNNGNSGNNNNNDNSNNDNDYNKEDHINSLIEKKEKIWVNNFWSAWDALNLNSNGGGASSSRGGSIKSIQILKKAKGLDLVFAGIEHAKDIQQIIFRTGMSLLERKLIKNLRLYRLCVLNDGSIPDLNVFNNPIILSKLGGWLLENIAEIEFLNNNNGRLKPLVVASLDVVTDTYLVIGLAPKYPRGMNNSMKSKLLQGKENKVKKSEPGEDDESDSSLTTRLNTFSVAFQQVSNSSGAKVRIDSFDSSVIEIRKDDLSPFLEKLTLSGLI